MWYGVTAVMLLCIWVCATPDSFALWPSVDQQSRKLEHTKMVASTAPLLVAAAIEKHTKMHWRTVNGCSILMTRKRHKDTLAHTVARIGWNSFTMIQQQQRFLAEPRADWNSTVHGRAHTHTRAH